MPHLRVITNAFVLVFSLLTFVYVNRIDFHKHMHVNYKFVRNCEYIRRHAARSSKQRVYPNCHSHRQCEWSLNRGREPDFVHRQSQRDNEKGLP